MRQRSGFTLVELSIVLVIIGLLIGGILAAQSMISTAKINAQVQQIGQFDAMVLNFKTQYNYLPGDAPAFGGDGDGIIDLTAASGANDDVGAFAAELGNFWHDIDASEFPGSAPAVWGSKPNISGVSKNVPASKLGGAGSYFIASAIGAGGSLADTTLRQNYYAIFGSLQAAAPRFSWYCFAPTTALNSAVRPVDALALDNKLDNGIADSGNVLSGGVGDRGDDIGGITSTPSTGICSSGPNYDLTHDSYECTPLIRIGGSVGVPQ